MSDNWLARISARVSGLTTGALALLLFFGLTTAEAQQSGTITGTVADASTLEPLSGVQVFVPGTDLGSLADEDGTYRITGVPAGEVQVRARLIGYRESTRTVDVAPGETVELNFELSVSAVSLDEVVVTATGEQRAREVGNAISTIDAAGEVERSGSQNLSSLIQGNSTGVTIRQSSGSVAAASSIKIRGNSSISLDNTPLVYVDGARIDNANNISSGQSGQSFSRLNDINPEDIQSIEIVKGPAAATLYGTEAAAGVIRITTKGGRSGTTTYGIRGEYGANWDVTEWPTSRWNPQSFGLPNDSVYTLNLLEEEIAPHVEEPFITGNNASVGANVRGGSESITYYLSGEWQDQEGNLPNNTLDQYNVRANFSLNPSDVIDISVSNGFTSNFAALPDNDNNAFGYIGVAMIAFPWDQGLVRDDPVTGEEDVETCALNFEIARAIGAPLSALGACPDNPFFGGRTYEDIATLDNFNDVERYTGSATLNWRPLDILSNRFTVGYDQFSERSGNIVPVDPNLPFGSSSLGFISRSDNTSRNLTIEGSSALNIDLTDAVNSVTTVGAQYFREVAEITGSLGREFPAGKPSVGNSVENEGFDGYAETITAGFFIQEQLSLLDRIFLTPAVRFDDNSAFGENLGLTAYPRVSASWVVSDEDFAPGGFETLKLRAAWGESGKQPGSTSALALVSPQPVVREGSDQLAVSRIRPANPELQPETGSELEVGFDASVLDGRLGLEFTYYDQTTENAIVTRPLAPSSGFSGSQFVNVGEMTNNGIEVSLDAVAMDLADVTWDWRVNFTTNNNEVTELDEPIIFGLGGSSQRHTVDFPYASYFSEPVFINENDEVEVGDEQFLGHPTPEWEGSVSSSLRLFDRVTVFGQVEFAGGHQLFNSTEEFQCGFLGGGLHGGICSTIFERTENDDGTFTYSDEARIKQQAALIQSEAPWIEDADYAKLRTVSLRYDLPQVLTSPLRAAGGSITIVGENLATWTGYTGLDPEINWAGGANASRAEFLTLPPARRVLARFSLNF